MTTNSYKQIVLHPYNDNWPKLFELEASEIRQLLGSHCQDIQHIGSTSVPGLVAKEDIDILCIVDDLKSSLILQEHDFVYKGEINIPLRFFFSKNMEHSKVNLHVVESDHGFIQLNLTFRDYLRTHPETLDAYAALKKSLVKDELSGYRFKNLMPRYTSDKSCFIHETLNKAGYDGITINFCFHKSEWEAYHRIRRQKIFSPAGKSYQIDDPIYEAQDHFHFVLYKETNVIAVAHVELVNESRAVIKELAVDSSYEGQNYDGRMRDIIKKWAKIHNFVLEEAESKQRPLLD